MEIRHLTKSDLLNLLHLNGVYLRRPVGGTGYFVCQRDGADMEMQAGSYRAVPAGPIPDVFVEDLLDNGFVRDLGFSADRSNRIIGITDAGIDHARRNPT